MLCCVRESEKEELNGKHSDELSGFEAGLLHRRQAGRARAAVARQSRPFQSPSQRGQEDQDRHTLWLLIPHTYLQSLNHILFLIFSYIFAI